MKNIKMKLPEAIKALQQALKNDPDYRESWKANIAVVFQDEVRRYKNHNNIERLNRRDIDVISNTAAESFLDLLCK